VPQRSEGAKVQHPEGDRADEPDIRDLLISHRAENADAALVLAERLESERHHDGRSMRVWLDQLDVVAGDSVVGAVNDGLAKSKHVGLLLTPEYFDSASGWTDAEWFAALHDDPAGRRHRVVPILLKDCPYIPPLLRHLNMVDLRGRDPEREYERLVSLLRGDMQRLRRTSGQEIQADGRLSSATLAAEKSAIASAPDELRESLLCNLLPMMKLPRDLWIAPIKRSLARGRGLAPSYPSKTELKAIIQGERSRRGAKPFSPAFRRDRDLIITFHRLDGEGSPLSPIIEASGARCERVLDRCSDPDQRRLITNLLNMALQRRLFRAGLTYDSEKERYFFGCQDDGSERKIKWRKRGRPRTVAKQLLDSEGEVFRWRHAAVRLRVLYLGDRWFVKVQPTVVFTRDGGSHSILRGSVVGPLATKWLARERNLHLAYHTHFWAHVLGDGTTPIRARAGDQWMVIDPEPLKVHMSQGIAGDQVNLEAELEEADDPDEGLDLDEYADDDDSDESKEGDSAKDS
jgi:hypothetical protein